MTEDLLLKYAQPVLIVIGLVVVLNVWNIISPYLKALRDLKECVIRLDERLKRLEKDVNNIGKLMRQNNGGSTKNHE